jgi:hypothetical protein
MDFYKVFFEIVGTDLSRVMEEIHKLGICSRSINSTFLEMIPKVDNPKPFDDFRPISLCNGVYKIMTKIIVNKVKPFLNSTIMQEQFGFVKGRLIHEAIKCAQEGTHSIKSQKRPILVIKIDLAKAYDRVPWLFMRLLLL